MDRTQRRFCFLYFNVCGRVMLRRKDEELERSAIFFSLPHYGLRNLACLGVFVGHAPYDITDKSLGINEEVSIHLKFNVLPIPEQSI